MARSTLETTTECLCWTDVTKASSHLTTDFYTFYRGDNEVSQQAARAQSSLHSCSTLLLLHTIILNRNTHAYHLGNSGQLTLVLVEGISIILHEGNSKMLYLMLMLMFEQDMMVDLCILSSIYQIPLPRRSVQQFSLPTTSKSEIQHGMVKQFIEYIILDRN